MKRGGGGGRKCSTKRMMMVAMMRMGVATTTVPTMHTVIIIVVAIIAIAVVKRRGCCCGRVKGMVMADARTATAEQFLRRLFTICQRDKIKMIYWQRNWLTSLCPSTPHRWMNNRRKVGRSTNYARALYAIALST